jgi:hypothetical protein
VVIAELVFLEDVAGEFPSFGVRVTAARGVGLPVDGDSGVAFLEGLREASVVSPKRLELCLAFLNVVVCSRV